MDNIPSKILEAAVNELSKLPGIGRKTALRLALHVLKQDKRYADNLGNSIINMRHEIHYCKICNNISDSEICDVCSNPARSRQELCIVQDIRDVMAIERTGQFKGLYHVLGGVISPIDGISADDLFISNLISKVEEYKTEEILFALPSTVEGDTTGFYLFKMLGHLNIHFTTIARGISIGEELEYIDEITLGRSILSRVDYQLASVN